MGDEQTPELTVGAAIKWCRGQRGLSARALSMQAGLSEAYVCRVESGLLAPSLRSFARLAIAVGMTDREISLLLRNEAARAKEKA